MMFFFVGCKQTEEKSQRADEVKTLSVNVPTRVDEHFQKFAQKAVVYVSCGGLVITETSLKITEEGISGSIENLRIGQEYLIEIVVSNDADTKGYYGEVVANITSHSVVDILIESLTGATFINGKIA